MTLLDGANNGQYTPEQAKLLAESLGLTDEQINSVVAAATATTAAWAEYNGYEYGVTGTDQAYTQDEIDDMVQNGEKTAEEGMSLKATQNAKVLKVGQDYLYAFMYDSTYTYTNDAGTSVTRRLTLSDMIGYLDEVEGYYEGGYIDEATYDEIQSKFTTSNKVSGGWHVRGLGTGTDGDTIYLTVGSTEAGYEEYMLDVGQKVTDAKEQRFLNKLATGNEYHAPSIEGEKASGATNVNSGVKPGKIVVAYGKMYIYTKAKGWAEVVDYRNNGHTMKAIAEWEEYNNGKEHSAPTPKPSWGYLS